MSSNLGWMFYKDYFKDLNYDNFSSQENKNRINMKINTLLNINPELESNEDEKLLGNLHLKATTTYPGLLIGSGNMHELPDIEGQLILGFHFDYTTGLPVIQGSSIKGVLRSAFKCDKEFKYNGYIKEVLKEVSKKEFDDMDIKKIEDDIFKNRDIFFDAVVIRKGGTLLSDDYLAPHKDKNGNYNELVEPTPLRFLKVSPNVTFRFDFEVRDGILSKKEKENLFIKLLEDLGVGAKTNVGYGKFDKIRLYKTEAEKREEKSLEDKEKVENIDTIDELERFIKNNPNSEILDFAKTKFQKLKIEKRKLELKSAWNKLDKKNRKHLESFKNSHKDDELAKEYILEIEKLLNNEHNQKIEQGEFNPTEYTKFKQLERYLKKFNSLNKKDVEVLKNHLLNNMNDKIKRKKFPFGTLQRFMSKEEANKIAGKLNLR
jgi:CRISPR-associated protein Cmr6